MCWFKYELIQSRRSPCIKGMCKRDQYVLYLTPACFQWEAVCWKGRWASWGGGVEWWLGPLCFQKAIAQGQSSEYPWEGLSHDRKSTGLISADHNQHHLATLRHQVQYLYSNKHINIMPIQNNNYKEMKARKTALDENKSHERLFLHENCKRGLLSRNLMLPFMNSMDMLRVQASRESSKEACTLQSVDYVHSAVKGPWPDFSLIAATLFTLMFIWFFSLAFCNYIT